LEKQAGVKSAPTTKTRAIARPRSTVKPKSASAEQASAEQSPAEQVTAQQSPTEQTPAAARATLRLETASEFDRLYRLWRESNDPALRERLILMHRSLVIYLARRFADRGESMDDVVQQGMIGLIYALDHFDPSRGVRFATFATPTIIGEIRRYFRDKSRGVRIPRRVQEMHQAILTKIESLTQEFNRSPTYREIAQSLSLPIEDVIETLESSRSLDAISLDEPFAGDDLVPLAERIGAVDPALMFSDEQSLLRTALGRLPEKHRVVLHYAYFENKSQIEIADLLHVSQMHVSRLLRSALDQLRKHLEEEYLENR